MADLALQSGQAKAQTQQQLWNTVGSTIMNLPSSVQQASYYDTMAQRQEHALAEDRAEKNRTKIYNVARDQFTLEDGSVDWDSLLGDVGTAQGQENRTEIREMGPGHQEGPPRREDSWAFLVENDEDYQNLRDDVSRGQYEDRNIRATEYLQSSQMADKFAIDLTDALAGIQGGPGTAQEKWEALQRLADPNSELMIGAQILDSYREMTVYGDRLRQLASTPWEEFIGRSGETEPYEVRPGDEWSFLEGKIMEGMDASERTGRVAAAAERIEIMAGLGADFRRPFRSMPKGYQAMAVGSLAGLIDLPRVGSQVDLDREWDAIDESLGGWLTQNPEARAVVEEKGLLHWPTEEDVKANSGLFSGKEAHTQENLFKLRLKDSGIESALLNKEAVSHEMLVWATGFGILNPDITPPSYGSDEWVRIAERWGQETGDYTEFEKSREVTGAETRGGPISSGGVTPTQERTASNNFFDGYSELENLESSGASIYTTEEMMRMGLAHMGKDGVWVDRRPDGTPLADNVEVKVEDDEGNETTEKFYNSRGLTTNPYLRSATEEQRRQGGHLFAMSDVKAQQQKGDLLDRYMSGIGAPSARMNDVLHLAWEDRVIGSGSGEDHVPPELPSNWPKVRDDEGNETDVFESYDSVKQRDPAVLERLFAQWASEFGIDELAKFYPSARMFDYSFYPKLVDRLLTSRGGPIYLNYSSDSPDDTPLPESEGKTMVDLMRDSSNPFIGLPGRVVTSRPPRLPFNPGTVSRAGGGVR
jgi:hypothetical protein